MRHRFATVPDVSWDDIGALEELREELSLSILQPITNPEQFESIGLTVPAGARTFAQWVRVIAHLPGDDRCAALRPSWLR